MKLEEAIKELKTKDYTGWIAKRNNPGKRLTKDDFNDEWYHSEITKARLIDDNDIEIEEKRTSVHKVLPATRYLILGLGEKSKDEY